MGRREAVPALEGAPVSDLPESADEPPDRGHLIIRLASDTKGTALEVTLDGYRLRGGATSAMRLFTRSFQGRMHQRAGVRFLQQVVQRLREKSNRDA
ncbi:MAG: hypothetical protein HYX95_01490 [Chloroflexi bacterium]|nr:hypothetical protein [Chloroflexota bacterium]